MIRILYRGGGGDVVDLQVGDLAEALKDPAGLTWVDMATSPIESVEPILSGTFGFHSLAIDDALHETHIPKLDDWQDYLYVVFRAVNGHEAGSDRIQLPELDIFLGYNYIVSYYQEPIGAVDRVWHACHKDQRWLKRGAAHLLYRFADELVSEAVAVVEQMQDDLEQIEGQLFAKASPTTLEELFALKRNILQLRRIVIPQRDVLNKLARNEYATVEDAHRMFFRDVYDHLLHLEDLLDDMLILVGGAMDIYLSVVNNRMNDIMKTLTVITALFMPLAFITGFFGMNFFQATIPLEAWTSELAFVLALALTLLVPFVMFLWMRRRAWI
jgi:magnesium transporter